MQDKPQSQPQPPPADKAAEPKAEKPKAVKKAKAPKFDEERELKIRMEKLIALSSRRRKAEEAESDAAAAHKSAKNRLDGLQEESNQIADECAAIRNGTFQHSLPMSMGEKPAEPPAGFEKLDAELRQGAEDALAAARAKKKGMSPAGLALSLFGGKRATKEQKAKALEILNLMAASGMVEQVSGEDKAWRFWPVKPGEKRPLEPKGEEPKKKAS
jgi:hypothetical protein